MSYLLIPVAPLSKSKSRLRDCFSADQLSQFTIALFKDLASTVLKLDCFEEIAVYCNSEQILKIGREHGFITVTEANHNNSNHFNKILDTFNQLIYKKYSPESTIICFIDLPLISEKNFQEISNLMEQNQILICPSIHSAGISIFGRKPPDVITASCFSDDENPSFISLYQEATKKRIERIHIYDSFRAGFDVDIKEDIILMYDYLKIFNLHDTYTYQFLRKNLKLGIRKQNSQNNREFHILEKNR